MTSSYRTNVYNVIETADCGCDCSLAKSSVTKDHSAISSPTTVKSSDFSTGLVKQREVCCATRTTRPRNCNFGSVSSVSLILDIPHDAKGET